MIDLTVRLAFLCTNCCSLNRIQNGVRIALFSKYRFHVYCVWMGKIFLDFFFSGTQHRTLLEFPKTIFCDFLICIHFLKFFRACKISNKNDFYQNFLNNLKQALNSKNLSLLFSRLFFVTAALSVPQKIILKKLRKILLSNWNRYFCLTAATNFPSFLKSMTVLIYICWKLFCSKSLFKIEISFPTFLECSDSWDGSDNFHSQSDVWKRATPRFRKIQKRLFRSGKLTGGSSKPRGAKPDSIFGRVFQFDNSWNLNPVVTRK